MERYYAHHDGLQWFIRDDLERSAQEEASQDSFTGKRFAVSGDAAYQALFAYLKSLPALPDEKPVLQPDGTSFYTNLPEMLHIRMLLSCLCDADYTATASHEDASLFTEAEEKELDAAAVLQSIYTYKEQISKNSNADAKLNQIRNEVFRSCLQAAEQPSGLFTLTTPTGTGKTLSLLAFAVKHSAALEKTTGKHDLYFVFKGGESYLFNLMSWKLKFPNEPEMIEDWIYGDLNGDLDVDAEDVRLHIDYLLGKIKQFPVEE
ncbi:MAG: hypothetical protein J6P20_00950 [Oscillospiraceae bacterium]|nr:hypothetical protein [Oscillospiraceae bacterium]